jgi:hypothetical protein
MNKKTLFALLLVVIVLFVSSLLLGAREPGSGQKFDLQSPNMTRINNWLSRPAKAEHLMLQAGSSAGCSIVENRIFIQPGATCVFDVSLDKVWTRRLKLVLVSPTDDPIGKVTVLMKQPEVLDVEKTLEPGINSEPLDIYGRKDQAVATLTIVATGTDQDKRVYVIEVVDK